MTLETDRLILRPWVESDAEWLYEYAKDPLVGPAAGWPVHTSVENSREIIQTILAVPETYAVELKSAGHVVGSISLKTGAQTNLTDREDEAEVGYYIGRPFWGQGLIPEAVRELQRHAFLDLGLQKLWCGYYDGNRKSRRVQEKCGFRFHHTREHALVEQMNEYRTEHITCLSRDEWEAGNTRDTIIQRGGTQ